MSVAADPPSAAELLALQALIELRPEPSLAFDGDGECLLANEVARSALGLADGALPRAGTGQVAAAQLPMEALRADWQVSGVYELIVGEGTMLVGLASRDPLAPGVHVLALTTPHGATSSPARFARQRDASLHQAAVECATVALVVLDNDRRVLLANAVARRQLRIAPRDVGDVRLDDSLTAACQVELRNLWKQVMSGDEGTPGLPLRIAAGPSDLELLVRPRALPDRHVGVITQRAPGGVRGPVVGRLSARERQILAGLAAGERTEQVAERLVLSADTVRTHVRNAMRKLGARSRVHAVVVAITDGEIDV